MKKRLISTLCVGIALMAVSCVEPIVDERPSVGGPASIKLSVNCASPTTKATAAGVETLNENKITTLDWFVFTASGDNAEAVEHGRKTYSDKNNVTEAFTVETLNMQPYVNPSTKTVTGYVYVIANLPAAYTHADDGIHYTSGSTSSTVGTKLGDLKKLEIVTTFDVLGADGKFKKQDAFVMASAVESFTLDENEMQKAVTAQLSRVASKITLDLSIVSAIDEIVAQMSGRDTLYEQYVQTWYPDVENIQVYLSYANGRTTIDRTLFDTTPYSYDDDTFFTYDRNGFTPTIGGSVTEGWTITGTPFYTYPMTWTLEAPHAPFIKIILPWRSYQETPTYEPYDYILHEVDPTSGQPTTRQGNKLVSASRTHLNDHSAAPQDFFYKISLPTEDFVLKSNTWFDIALDVAILGGRSDDLSMEVAGKYYVVDWNNPDFTAGGALAQGSYLKLGADTYYIYGGDFITIPVLSSHDVTATVTRARYTNFSGDNPTGANISSSSYSTTSFSRDSFKLTHTLNRNINSNNLDCSVDTFYVRVANGAGLTKDITIIQQPSLYISSESSNKYVFINANSNHASSGWTSGNYKLIYDDNSEKLGALRNYTYNASNNSNYNIYTINVSDVSGNSYGWYISDPRKSAGETISSLRGGNSSGTALSNYHRADNQKANAIAPRFKIASSSGASNYTDNDYSRMTYEQAVRRCASYQENGYPAGRWRIPTDAEIRFVIQLSNHSKIPSLFNGTYWAASGTKLNNSGNETTTNNGASVRCVYDAWYWGNEPIDAYKTTWSGWRN